MTISAELAFRLLNGLFFVYKPPRMGKIRFRKAISATLCRDLNKLEVRPTAKRVVIQGELSKGEDLTIKLVQNYADHPLVVGPRYQVQDFILRVGVFTGYFGSGLVPIGIGLEGMAKVDKFVRSSPVRCYELKGRLGFATLNYTILEGVREKATYKHVSKTRLDMLLAKIEGYHQEKMVNILGAKKHTQEAYELMSKGLIRPENSSDMIIYSIKCVHFRPPDIVVEVQCVNEKWESLARLVHDIGLGLKTFATAMSIRRTRCSKYTVDHALLLQQLNLNTVLHAIDCVNRDVTLSIDSSKHDYLLEEPEEDDIEDKEDEKLELKNSNLPEDYYKTPLFLE